MAGIQQLSDKRYIAILLPSRLHPRPRLPICPAAPLTSLPVQLARSCQRL